MAFEIQVPITVKGGKREGRDIGKEIANQIKKAVDSLGLSSQRSSGIGKGGGGGMGALIGGVTKVTVLVAIIAEAIKAIGVFLKPVFTMFKAIMMLLFLPLIPILKPVMMLLGIMAKTLAPIMQKVSTVVDTLMSKTLIPFMLESADKLSDFYVKFATFMLDMIQIFVENLPSISKVLSWFADQGQVFFDIILDLLMWAGSFLADTWGIIKEILVWAGNFLTTKWETIKGILDWISIWLDPIWQLIKGALETAHGIVVDKWDAIKGALEDAYDIVVTKWQPIKNALETVLVWINSIIDGFKNAWDKISNFSISSVFGGGRSKSGEDDFISRPGQAPISFSKDDTIIGIKNPATLGKSIVVNNTITGNQISSELDMSDLARRTGLLVEMDLKKRGIL